MTRAAQLWRQAAPVAERCRLHPFVQGLADGTLAPARYRAFIAQDAYFLEAFARAYAHCLATAPDREGLYAFRALLNGVFDELQLHAAAARDLDIDLDSVVPLPATRKYTSFLASASSPNATLAETLAAMAPCMRLYAHLGVAIAPGATEDTPYREWIHAYAGLAFQDLAATIERLLDRYSTGSPGEERAYQGAMQLELAFFDAAWSG